MTASASQHSGLDLSALDPDIRPQDDLFGHVNGTWLREHVIPADRSADGEFRRLRDVSEEQVRAIVEAAAADTEAALDTDTGRIGALFRLFMDEHTLEEAGSAPIQPLLHEIAAVTDLPDLVSRMSAPDSGGSLLFSYVWTDDQDSSRYQLRMHQAGLGLPDESYYREEAYATIRSAYIDHLERLAVLAELPGRDGLVDGDARALAQAVMDFETRLAQCHVDVVRLRDREKSSNPMDAAQRAELAPAFPWDAYIEGSGAPAGAFDVVCISQPEYVRALDALLQDEDLAVLRTWLALQTVSSYAPYLSSGFVAEDFSFQGTVLSGSEEIRERWKRGVALVEGVVGFAVGQQYVAEHFPPEHKQRMQTLVTALLEAYRRSISDLDWMTPETREKALTKLEKFTPKVGYPDSWREYDGLDLTGLDLIGALRAGRLFDADHEFDKLSGPVDTDEWHMTPQTVNAYYNPGANEIVFPAAILQPPFFDADAEDAVNFGGIGAVIGHEIGHGFDDQGSKYDGDGNLRSWWNASDRAEFEARASRLIDQFSALSPRDLDETAHVNGALTIGENIGDLGGLSIALAAYRATRGEDDALLDGYTGLQRVFLSWATVWRAKTRPQEAERRLATDPHAPAEFRCNVPVSHIDAFYDAFDVQPGDRQYLDPADRVRIW